MYACIFSKFNHLFLRVKAYSELTKFLHMVRVLIFSNLPWIKNKQKESLEKNTVSIIEIWQYIFFYYETSPLHGHFCDLTCNINITTLTRTLTVLWFLLFMCTWKLGNSVHMNPKLYTFVFHSSLSTDDNSKENRAA